MDNKTYKAYEPETLKRLQTAQLEILEKFIAVCDKYDLTYIMLGGTGIGVVRHQGFIPWDDDIDVAMPRKDYDRFLEVYSREMGPDYRILTPLVDKNYACNVTHLQKLGTRFVPYTSKDMKCDLCIDIDIFPMDHMPDDKRKRSRQLRKTWFLNKLIFLCGTPRPIIPLTGAARKVSEVICFLTHYALKVLHVSPRFLYRCLVKECTKYNHTKTKYINAFEVTMSDRAYISREELYPLQEMQFEHLTVKMPHKYDTYLRRLFGDYMQMPPEEKRVNHCPYILDFGDEIKKYCIFSAQYPPHMGGVERYTYYLAQKLAAKGHDVTVVTSEMEGSPSYEREGAVKVYRLPSLSLMNGRYPVLMMNRKCRKLARMIGAERYDLVIVNTRFYPLSLYAAFFAKCHKTRCIFVEHGTGHMTLHNPALDFMENIVEHTITAIEKRLCREYYGVSEACLDWLRHFHIQGSGTLYNAIDVDEAEAMLQAPVRDYREEYHIPENAIVIAFTGRLLKEKGILTLIKAVETLNREGMDLYLLIAGEGEEDAAVDAAKSEHIIPLGRIETDEVYALLKTSDIFCLPTGYAEGMPTSVLEAIACRCFVITSRSGGAREILTDRSYGTILEDNREETVARALREAAEDPELRKNAAEKAHQRLVERFTWDAVAEKIVRLSKDSNHRRRQQNEQ